MVIYKTDNFDRKHNFLAKVCTTFCQTEQSFLKIAKDFQNFAKSGHTISVQLLCLMTTD